MDSRKSLAEMSGEWMREASVLVLVFAWLDKRVKAEPITGAWALEAFGVFAILFTAGVVLELTRPES